MDSPSGVKLPRLPRRSWSPYGLRPCPPKEAVTGTSRRAERWIPRLGLGDSQRFSSFECFARAVASEKAEPVGDGLTPQPTGRETMRDGQPGPRVLVVDDEQSITDLVGMALRYEGFQVEVAPNGHAALTAATSFRPHLIVLDVMLPDVDGFEVQRRLAADRLRVPILFLTARDETEAKVHGLTMGADDYVTKPFSVEELMARVHAILRRSGQMEKRAPLEFADLEMDEDTREVWRGGGLVELSPTEFNLLRYLLLNARRVVSKAQIVDHVWRYDFGGDPRIVENYISYLRKKIDFKEPRLIHTVRGVGYSLRLPR
jgi:two-component system OmpR family response regulator